MLGRCDSFTIEWLNNKTARNSRSDWYPTSGLEQLVGFAGLVMIDRIAEDLQDCRGPNIVFQNDDDELIMNR